MSANKESKDHSLDPGGSVSGQRDNPLGKNSFEKNPLDKGGQPTLKVVGLRAGVEGLGSEILRGVDLEVMPGEVVALMGPNGSGKSTLGHVLMGRPGYKVLGGNAYLEGKDLLAMPVFKRAQAGLFLAHQYPVEVPGVPLDRALLRAMKSKERNVIKLTSSRNTHVGSGDINDEEAVCNLSSIDKELTAELGQVGLDQRFLSRPLNMDLSGGEKKRSETAQIGLLKPKLAVLDEIDSGLDVDALVNVANRLVGATTEWGLALLVITHFNRLLTYLKPNRIYVMSQGQIVDSGGPELALSLEGSGYAQYGV